MKVFSFSVLIALVSITINSPVQSQNIFGKVGGEQGKLLNPEVLVIADNQETFDYGGAIYEQALGINNFTPSARRNAITKLFSLSLVEQFGIEAKKKGANFILHAGDAMNNGCKSEFERFSHSMDNTGLPWFFSPGNHDAFYLGISNPLFKRQDRNKASNDLVPLNWVRGWSGLCWPMRFRDKNRTPDDTASLKHVFTKRELIKAYLANLITSEVRAKIDTSKVRLPNLAKNKSNGIPVCIHDTNVKFLHRICWYHADNNTRWNNRKPWKDFIIQEIRWKAKNTRNFVSTILVDTSNYDLPQRATKNCYSRLDRRCRGIGGIKASIGNEQRKIIERWLHSNKTESEGKPIPTIIMGHHPFRSKRSWEVEDDMQNWLSSLASNFPNTVVISAHTHSGYFTQQSKNNGKAATKKNLTEFNVGSTTDAPVETVHLNWVKTKIAVQPKLQRIFHTSLAKEKNRKGFLNRNNVNKCKKMYNTMVKVGNRNATPDDRRDAIRPIYKWLRKPKLAQRGLVSQLRSLHNETIIWNKVLPARIDPEIGKGDSKDNDLIKVCYRTGYDYRTDCGGKDAKESCATSIHLDQCNNPEFDMDKFTNLAVIESTEDAMDVAFKLHEQLSNAFNNRYSKSKAYRLRRESSRKLHAISLFDKNNPPKNINKYRELKACLALIASRTQRIEPNWWKK